MLPKDLDPARFPRQDTRFTELGHEHGHAHSRRRFLAGAAGLTGAALGTSILSPVSALAKTQGDPTPKPIPGGLTFGGVTFPSSRSPPIRSRRRSRTSTASSVFCDVQGTGTARNPDGTTERLPFDTDMRFVQGDYVAADGHMRQVHDFDPGIFPYPEGLLWTSRSCPRP